MKSIFKKLTVITLILGFSFTTLAQKPAWADYYKRQSLYPESQFIIGYVSGINTNDDEPGKLKSIYEVIAKDKLIQSIQVEIETNNSLNISNVNGKSDEEFLSKSVSFSKANVNGLNTQSYYDRKKKEVFAIAFVNKKELAFFYRNIIKSGIEDINQKLSEGRKYVKKDDKENALRSFYETMPVLNSIDEARILLIALNRKMYADIDIDEINNLKLELINEIDDLIKPTELNLSESAYFVAYGLFLQINQIEGLILMDNFTFENTGLESRFSEKWKQEITSALVKVGKYEIASAKERTNQLVVHGNYWREGELIKVNASISKNKQIIAVSKGSIPLSWLEKENIDYIPVQIKKMEALTSYKLKLISAPETVKLRMPLTIPIKTKVVDNLKAVHGIPISIRNTENNKLLCNSETNEFGHSVCFLPAIQTDQVIIRLEASIDLLKYLSINENSIYFTIASGQNPIAPITIDIKTEKPTIYIQSEELIQGKAMDIKTLEPSLKEVFAVKGYNFVNNEKDADFKIKIKANTTTGSNYQGIYFAYLDINLSVTESSTGEEIYKTHLDQIKGGGNNNTKAGKKAYVLGAKKLKENLKDSFFN